MFNAEEIRWEGEGEHWDPPPPLPNEAYISLTNHTHIFKTIRQI